MVYAVSVGFFFSLLLVIPVYHTTYSPMLHLLPQIVFVGRFVAGISARFDPYLSIRGIPLEAVRGIPSPKKFCYAF